MQKPPCNHAWDTTGNSMDGDTGRGIQMKCMKCGTIDLVLSKGPCLGYMMRRAYNAFLGTNSWEKIPEDQHQAWLAAVKAVVETPHLITTITKGDTIHAYPNGVVNYVASKASGTDIT